MLCTLHSVQYASLLFNMLLINLCVTDFYHWNTSHQPTCVIKVSGICWKRKRNHWYFLFLRIRIRMIQKKQKTKLDWSQSSCWYLINWCPTTPYRSHSDLHDLNFKVTSLIPPSGWGLSVLVSPCLFSTQSD